MITNGEEMIMVLLSRRSRPARPTPRRWPAIGHAASGPGWSHGQDPDLDPDLAVAAAHQPRASSGGLRSARSTPATGPVFAYVDAVLSTASRSAVPAPLRRISPPWGFAIYRASHDDYEDSYLPTGYPVGTCRRSPRHRLRPLPQRPHRLDLNPRRTNRRDH